MSPTERRALRSRILAELMLAEIRSGQERVALSSLRSSFRGEASFGPAGLLQFAYNLPLNLEREGAGQGKRVMLYLDHDARHFINEQLGEVFRDPPLSDVGEFAPVGDLIHGGSHAEY